MAKHTLAGLQGREDLQKLSVRAEGELREIVHDQATRLFGSYLGEAVKALTKADDRKTQDMGRSLKQHERDWVQAYIGQLENRLFLARADDEDEAAQDDRASVGLIAMAKALLLAETQYFKVIAEIDARLNRIRLIMDLQINSKALAPTGLHQAMLRTLDQMRWPASGRDQVFMSFERHFISKLEPLYQSVVECLREIGSEAAKLVVNTAMESAAPETPAEQRAKEKWMQPPDDQLEVDDTTAAMLTRLALEGDGDGYTDGLLAADLLALMDKRPLPGIAKERGWVPVQRTSLAGHFLNEVKSDPTVRNHEADKHESLRMPLVKSALADSSVFTDASHPLASLIDEHMTKAARHRLQNRQESEQMADSLHDILAMFDLAPDFVRESMSTAEPLEDAQIQRFYELQRKQAAQRREFVIGEAKRIVAEEIERSSFARDVPPPAQRFLTKVWAALMTQRLLKFGASDDRWNDSIDKMDQLIDMLESRNPKDKPPDEWVNLIKHMCDDLTKGGLPATQKAAVLKMLEAARKSP